MTATIRVEPLPTAITPTFKLSTRAAPDTLLSTIYTGVVVSGRPTIYTFAASVADGDYAITQLQSPYATGVVRIAGSIAKAYDSFEQLDAAESGGGTVTVLPASITMQSRFTGRTLELALGETCTISQTYYAADRSPLSFAGKTLSIVFETIAGSEIATIDNADIVVSGDDDNTITFAIPSPVTSVERTCDSTILWAVRSLSDGNTDLVDGPCIVRRVAGAIP